MNKIYIPMFGDTVADKGFKTREEAQAFLDSQEDWVVSDEGWILELPISE